MVFGEEILVCVVEGTKLLWYINDGNSFWVLFYLLLGDLTAHDSRCVKGEVKSVLLMVLFFCFYF